MTIEDILDALREAYKRARTQMALAKMAGVSQGRIADYLNGRCSVENMTISTFLRLFPDMTIDFFGKPAMGITVHGSNSGAIAQGENANAVVSSFSMASTLDKNELENKILHEASFTDSERIKILLFLKDKVK